MDVMRIAAALAVVVSHSYATVGRGEPRPLEWNGVFLTWGSVAVAVFFTLSGFLVTQSWDSDPSAGRWSARRFARIWPGLIVVLVAVAFVVGPVVADIGPSAYFTLGGPYRYVFNHARFAEYQFLPGVFEDHTFHDVNASLWTLQLEVICYLLLLVLAVTGVLRHKSLLVGLAVVVVAWSWAQDLGGLALPFFEHGVFLNDLLRLSGFFALGALAARLRLRFDWWLAGLCALFLILSRHAPLSGLGYVALAYVIMWVATRPWPRVGSVRRLGDPSYGWYLWAWPIQQLLVEAGMTDPYRVMAFAVVLSLAAGYLSWYIVERPAGRLITRRLAPRGTGQAAQAVESSPTVASG